MRFFLRNAFFGSCTLLSILLTGCRSIYARMNADGSWEASYYSYGLFTDLGSMSVSVGTNGVASLTLNDLTSDVSTNHVRIVDASGNVAVDITGAIVEGLVK